MFSKKCPPKTAAGTAPGIFIPVDNRPCLDSITSCSDNSSKATIEFNFRKCFNNYFNSKTSRINTHSLRLKVICRTYSEKHKYRCKCHKDSRCILNIRVQFSLYLNRKILTPLQIVGVHIFYPCTLETKAEFSTFPRGYPKVFCEM